MTRLNRYTLRILLQASLLLIPAFAELHAQWVKLSQFTDFYNEVFFYDQNLGFITSHNGSVLRTINGGATWGTVTLPGASFSANRDICFVSSSDGFISGEDGIWKTANGGATWTSITPAGATTIGSSSSWFRNASVGVWGYGHCLDSNVTFWRTTDGGATWASVTLTHTPDVAVGGMTYSAGRFYASGSSGKFWQSTDDGATWTLSNTNSAGWQEDLIVSPAGSLLIASADGTSCAATGGGKILMSTNGGANWTTNSYPNTVMWGVSMYSGTNGWAVGDLGKAYKTTDGGATWALSACGIDPGDRLDDVYMIDATHGFAVGDGIYRFAINEFVSRPDTINFGDVVIGTTRGDSIAAVRGIGTTGTISMRAILGTDATDFSSPSSLTNPQTIPDCNEVATLLRFHPTTTGVKIARLEFTITGLSAPLVVYLKGRGVRPRIVGPKSQQLDTLVCEFERIDTLIFSNNGDHPLKIDSVRFVNNLGTFTLLSPVPPFEIAPFRSEELIIKGQSAGTGLMSAKMYIYTNDPDYQDTAWMTTLTMYRKLVQVDFADDTIVIPSRPPDSTSSICIAFKNTGEQQMSAGTITTTMPDPTISSSFTGPRSVKAGDSILICFSARATDTLGRCKTFQIISQPCNVTRRITVCYQASVGALDMPSNISLTAGCDESVRDTFYLHNRGNAAASVRNGEVGGTDKDAFSMIAPTSWPSVIPAGDSLEVILSFTPDGSKATSQAFFVVSLDDGSKDSIPVTGILAAPIIELTEHFNDIGPICPGKELNLGVYLLNTGTAGTSIERVNPLEAEDRIEVSRIPNDPIAQTERDSILFIIRSTSPGPISARYEIVYDSPCLERDTITIVGTVLEQSLSIDPSSIDFGIVPVSKNGVGRTTVRNESDTTVKVTVSDPGIPGVAITHPAADVELAPRDTLQITLLFTPAAEATLNGMLPIRATGRCDEDYEVVIRGSGVDEAVYITGDFDFGTLLCYQARQDTFFVHNQSIGQARISSAVLSNPSGFSLELPQALPIPIAPGDSIPLLITTLGGTNGLISTQVLVGFDQGPITELTATVQFERLRTDTRFVERDGTPLDSFLLPPMSSCRTTFDTVLILQNSGNIPDTIDLDVSESVVSVTSSLPIIVPPGETVEVAIRVNLASRGLFAPVVRGVSRPCRVEMLARTAVEYVGLEDGEILFGERCVSRDSTVHWPLRNTTGHPISVREIAIVDEVVFTVKSSAGFVLAPGETREIELTFAPDADRTYAGKLLVVTDSPCADTVTFILKGDGTTCAIPELVLRTGNARGRWGTIQRVPVTVSGYNLDAAEELNLKMTASPTMLHPEAIRFFDWADGKWSVTDRSFDPTEGVLTITLTQQVVGSPAPSNVPLDNVPFFTIEFTVLRGDSTATDLDLELVSNLPDGTIRTEDGEFLLEDYCDAYGRLLRTTGNLALRPSIPNPVSESATIEYELPFTGHAILSIIDLGGNEILTPLDDVVPAGRRQTVVDVSTLPSGIYTVRLTIGLQTLTQRMVVAK